MLIATIGLLGAAISRWPFAIMQTDPWPFFLVTDLFVLAGVCYDLVSRGHIHSAYVWGGLLLLVSQPARLAISHTLMRGSPLPASLFIKAEAAWEWS